MMGKPLGFILIRTLLLAPLFNTWVALGKSLHLSGDKHWPYFGFGWVPRSRPGNQRLYASGVL